MDLLNRCHLEDAIVTLWASAVLISLLLLSMLNLSLNLLEAWIVVNRVQGISELTVCCMHGGVSLWADLVPCNVVCFQIVSSLSVYRMAHSLIHVLIRTLILLSELIRANSLLLLQSWRLRESLERFVLLFRLLLLLLKQVLILVYKGLTYPKVVSEVP